MEFCRGGDLADAIEKQKLTGQLFDASIVQSWFGHLVLGLSYMKQMNLIHRDLKPANVFLTNFKVLKIGDFGLSKNLDSSSLATQTVCGTPIYMAPEIVSANFHGSEARWLFLFRQIIYEDFC